MIGERAPTLLALGSTLALWLRLAFSYAELPELMASHFDATGRPNGYQSKRAFVGISVALNLLFLLLVLTVPTLIRHMPDRHLNLPNKDYWLSPERREQTHARLIPWIGWFLCATVLLLCSIVELVIRANLRGTPLGPQAWLLIGGYLVFMLFSSVGLMRAFRRP